MILVPYEQSFVYNVYNIVIEHSKEHRKETLGKQWAEGVNERNDH